ncbi:18489_t:CDS:2 [Dentiscutata erythropus]|uniref:18489_t:CDS:1 n=1 Tax=Dentiscutata erythropus TaxID=1348616 RepID=A0A9N9A5S1_9GLOM|nr:18489_t:CDS:2 [Dentiscutata erythropus]
MKDASRIDKLESNIVELTKAVKNMTDNKGQNNRSQPTRSSLQNNWHQRQNTGGSYISELSNEN